MKQQTLILLSIFSLFGSSLVAVDDATEPPPPEVVEQQLAEAEEEFHEAEEMFNPWYAGPLLTASAHVVPGGSVNVQGYLFVTDNYAKFNSHGHTRSIKDLIVVNPVLNMQIGIIKWMSSTINLQSLTNIRDGISSTDFGDLSWGLNFALLQEGPYNPAISFRATETFPTGKYQRLNPNKHGLDATGAGSYQSTFSFNVSKVVWWVTKHPMNLRTSLNYTIPSNVGVHDFNAYGGVYGTAGNVHPGQNFSGNIGYEYSFTQHWVFALDTVYSYTSETTFSGNPGITSSGAKASLGGPYSDVLSFAPALEYNFSSNFGVLGGVWFSAWGRNSLDFISGIISATYTW